MSGFDGVVCNPVAGCSVVSGYFGSSERSFESVIKVGLNIVNSLPGLRSNVQVTRECFALDPCSCWRSSLGTGIKGKTFTIALHF